MFLITDEEYSDGWLIVALNQIVILLFSLKLVNVFMRNILGSIEAVLREVLSLIQDSENGLKLANSINFAGGSLFCEWAYVIDLTRILSKSIKALTRIH